MASNGMITELGEETISKIGVEECLKIYGTSKAYFIGLKVLEQQGQ